MRIVFDWIMPSLKNSKQVFCQRRGKKIIPVVLPSTAYQDWHKEESEKLKNVEKIEWWNLKFYYKFFIPKNKDWSIPARKFDYSNKIESINDLLVDLWIIEDDNYSIISEVFIDSEIVEFWEWKVELNIEKQLNIF